MAVVLLLLAAFTLSAVAQETTAGLQGIVRDPTGAVVSKATVEITGEALIGAKKMETDAAGYYRFANLPPGEYMVAVTAKGFSVHKQRGVKLEVGKLPNIDITLQVGSVAEIVEVSGEAPLVDVSQSKVAVNIPEEVIAGIPKGRSFQSLIQFAAGARYEPLQSTTGTAGRATNGYQIDGASNSENSYLIEGQETSDVYSGQTKTNAPFEFIQEVQVKTSGFEAEYGGALGGVVNVIQKRGSNAWHGSVGMYYSGDIFNAAPSRLLRWTPDDRTDPVTGDTAAEYYQRSKDHYRTVEPGFEVGGYLKKDRLWVFMSSIPSLDSRNRTINFTSKDANGTPYGPRKLEQNTQTYYSLARVDALLTQKIRVYGSWLYQYQRGTGAMATADNFAQADSPFGQTNEFAGNNPDNYNAGIGYVAPNVVYNTGADITLSPTLVATTRYGYFYSDGQDRGLPVGIRYQFRQSDYNYQNAGTGITATTTGLGGAVLGDALPASMFHLQGYRSMPVNQWQVYDKFGRKSFSQDLAWFKKGLGGTHNLKFGYALNRLSNKTLQTFMTANVHVAFNKTYTVLPAAQDTCAAIRAENLTKYGDAGSADNTSCRGLWGTYNVREVSTVGNVASNNHALFVQDAWTLGNSGVTVNAGVRFDKENLPSYTNGFPGITFGFGDKVAPRLGFSWDVLKKGKVKAYASFGYFYDIMKYSLPSGSFGGDYWHDCVYTLDDPDYTKIKPVAGSDGHFCPKTGGATGTVTGRFIQNQDFRQPSNDPSDPRIDPNLKPMKQHEWVTGADWAIKSNLALEVRYSRKRLDRTIEDSGVIRPDGEAFFIVNPGEGIDKQPIAASDCVNCPIQPKASRRYDGLEFRLTRRESAKWFGTISYTYSRLRGNYSGLTSTEVMDGGGGRSDPNVSRSFDEPMMQYDSHGKLIDGPLATDRPHTLKAYGWVRLPWFKKNETMLGLTQAWYSGTPISTYMEVDAGAAQYVENRGNFVDFGIDPNTGAWSVKGIRQGYRTPSFSQTDLNFVHEFKVSPTNEALRLTFEVNAQNLFNQKSVLGVDSAALAAANLSIENGPGVPANSVSGVDYKTFMTGYNYANLATTNGLTMSSLYGKADTFQAGRSFRFRIKFSF
jgi:hypothetical protein